MTKMKSNVGNAESENGLLDERFDELVKETLKFWHVPGFSVGVVDGDKTWSKAGLSQRLQVQRGWLILEGYGIAAFPDTPVTPSTLFYAGSTTKAFTSAMMSLLVDDNEKFPAVQWNTPINQLIREDFVLEDEYCTNHITIEDALSHRTGMPRHDKSYGGDYDGHKGTVKDVVRSLRHLPLTVPPRTKFQYCNTMYVAATHVIEEVTGSKLGDLLHKHIWRPLGMKTTFLNTAPKKDLAVPYYHSNGAYYRRPWPDLELISGAGSVISNVLDYNKWAQALMKRTTPLSEKAHSAMWTPRMLQPEEQPYTGSTYYCLGWISGVYQGHRFYDHAGGVDAYGTQVILFPDLNFSVVMFANTFTTSNLTHKVLAFHLIDEKLGIPKEKQYDWTKDGLKRLEDEKKKFESAKQRFYPSLPSPALPPTAPLEKHSGTYYHPGYRYLTIKYENDNLFADRSDTTWPEKLTFQHMSGNYFLVRVDTHYAWGVLAPDAYPAEFRFGPDGKVCEVGIGWEPDMGEKKIWLKRV